MLKIETSSSIRYDVREIRPVRVGAVGGMCAVHHDVSSTTVLDENRRACVAGSPVKTMRMK